MPEENMPLDQQEQLRNENEFMKMKLMLERGATFGEGAEGSEIPPEVEHKFLSNIIDFEKQWDEGKRVTVYEKIGKPGRFKPAKDIPANQIEKEWNELSDHLEEYGISLDACSPNVTHAELYRFTVEELFQHEIDDINIPGMMTCFIYDEFHPDHAYDNTRLAVDDCIKAILCKEPLRWTHFFSEEDIQLNEKKGLKVEDLKAIIDQFKSVYDSIELRNLDKINCTVKENTSVVNGQLSITLSYGNQKEELTGNWKVDLESDSEFGRWRIKGIQIPGINF